MANKPKKKLPAELEGVAHAEDVNALQEQIEKCYSAERYEDFQTAVEKIIGRYLKTFIAWGLLLWLSSIIGSMLIQKFWGIF